MREHRYVPGKIDYNNRGRKDCEAEITWTLQDGRFSMCAGIWNHIKTDMYCAGQCVEEIAKYFPANKKVQRMLAIWRDWHLNDLRAGTLKQETHLKALTFPGYPVSHYDWARSELAKVGLQPDDGYSYGSAWLTKSLPPEIIAEINSWSGAIRFRRAPGQKPRRAAKALQPAFPREETTYDRAR